MTAVRVAVLCLVLGAGGLLGSTHAALSATTANPGSAFTAAVLHPPTGLTVSQSCVPLTVPIVRSSSFTGNNNSASTLSVARPSGVQAGDVLVAGVAWFAPGPLPTPTGWTKIREEGFSDATQALYVRVATGAEAASYSWTYTVAASVGGIAAYSGVDVRSPVDASSGTTGMVKGRITAPSLTTTTSHTRLFGMFSQFGVQELVTADAAMTRQWGGQSIGAGGPQTQVSVVGADESRPAVGTTGDRVSTTSTGQKSVGQLVALRSASSGAQVQATWVTSLSTFSSGQTYRLRSGGATVVERTLGPSITSATDGRLTSGTQYTVEVLATHASWRSTTAGATFTANPC